MRILRGTFPGLGLLLAIAGAADAQAFVRGRVFRAGTTIPLPGAEIVPEGALAIVRTDGSGRFELRGLGPGRTRLLVRHVGFQPQTVEVSPDSTGFDEIEVRLTETAVSLDALISTATREPQSLTDAPAAASVVDTATILGSRTVGMNEVLRHIPGVAANSKFGSDEVSIGIRGSGIRTRQAVRGIAVLLDGVALTEPDGAARLDLIELAAARQVEVVRGPVSALYGGSSGGVVNVLSRTGRETRGVQVRAQAGAWGLAKYDGWGGSGLNGDKGSVFAAGSYSWAHGFRDHSQYRIARGLFLSDVRTGSGGTVTLEAGGSSLDTQTPGSLTQAQADSAPHMASPIAVSWVFGRKDTRWRIGTRVRQPLRSSDVSTFLFFGGRTLDFPIPGQIVDLNFHRLQTGARFRMPALARGRFEVTVGAELDWLYGTDQRWENESGSHGAIIDDGTMSLPAIAGYAQAAWHARQDIDLTFGLRYEYTRFQFESVTPDLIPAQDTTVDQVSPKVTLTWRPTGGATFYASVAKGFEVPAIGELSPSPGSPFNDIRPKSLWNFEVGGHATLEDWFLLDAALFYADVDGEFIPQTSGNQSEPENASRSRNIGFELAATARPREWLSVTATYAWLDMKLLEYRTFVNGPSGLPEEVDYSGNQLPGLPRHRFTLMTRARAAGSLDLGAQLEWQGAAFVETANMDSGSIYVGPPGQVQAIPFRSVPARALVHLDANTVIGPFGIFASLENVFGLRYTASIIANEQSGRYYEPGAGRTLAAGVRITLRP